MDAEFTDAATILASADVLLCVQPPDIERSHALKAGAVVVGFMQAYARPISCAPSRAAGITSFAMELVPRISRAQSMDALSSQASVAGYKAALIAANTLEKFLPMLTTAAGTIRPASVLVIGAGVAGLQAIATAKRLGAVVEAYDVRSATKDQVKSLGAKFIETGVSAEGAGGYARELTAGGKAQAAGSARCAYRRERCGDQHRVGAGQSGAAHHQPRGGRAHEGRLGHRRHRRRAGRQLRAHPRRRDRVSRRSEDPGPGQPAGFPALSRQRNVLAQFVQLAEARTDQGELAVDWKDEVFSGAALTHDGQIKHEATRTGRGGLQS